MKALISRTVGLPDIRQALTSCMNVTYIIGYERASSVWVYCVYSVIFYNNLIWIREVWLVFIMECDFVYEDFEGFLPFQNIHVDVNIVQFSKMYPSRLVRFSSLISIYGSTALVNSRRFLSFVNCTQSVGLLGRAISRRKVSTYTQNNTNTEIRVSSGIRTHDPSVWSA
jgi:hypothetical protein